MNALLVLAALLAAGAAWQRLELARAARAPLARGRMADAGGFRLRIAESGAAHAGPTVLLECGIAGPTSASWAWVQRGVAEFAPVVSYDRAGLGRSDEGPLPRDGRAMARELRAALAGAGIPGPFVFTGHSFGGLVARFFVDEFPADVAGVVLVESSHPRQMDAAGLRLWHDGVRVLLALSPLLTGIGLVRAIVRVAPLPAMRLPEPERSEQLGHQSSARHWRGVAREFDAWLPRTAPQAAACGTFGSRPLVVLTAGGSAAHYPGWAACQADLVRLSDDAVHRVVPGADHALMITDPRQSRAVVDAIRDVAAAVRERRPLAKH